MKVRNSTPVLTLMQQECRVSSYSVGRLTIVPWSMNIIGAWVSRQHFLRCGSARQPNRFALRRPAAMSDSIAEIQAKIGDRYVIERELARGGMATVYLARDTRHPRRVALKVMDSSVTGAIGVDRFFREIHIAARLTHPHIVPLFDSGSAAGTGGGYDACLYYVMPFIAGESLRERLNAVGPLPLADVVAIVREVAGALDYAHQQGIVHRDIKPENVLLSEGHAVVADFGIARAVLEAASPGSNTLTQSGMLVGTPSYMSAEQAGGESDIDGRSDQYSLACVVFEMLAGRPPFAGSNQMALLAQHLTVDPPPLRALVPVPDAVEHAIRRALAKDPADRFASTSDFAKALDVSLHEPGPDSPRLPGSASGARQSRIPVPLTPLLGREQEVRTVCALLHREGVRLLTLHGPGGIGKTRLALEVAVQANALFPDGVYFVPLAEARDVDELFTRVALAVGLKGSAAASRHTLLEHLHGFRSLLVLDNMEQLADNASHISAMLAECAGLKVLITSQVLLRLYGEHELPVEPLAVPSHRLALDLPALADSPAVKLFVQRAVAARSDFQLDNDNASAVVEICALLDGVPLALELAAARIKVMSAHVLLTRLRQALDVLTGGARDVPARQRTMRGAIAWTHDLLSDEERLLFRRLAVFAGGATADAAAATLAERMDTARVEDLLASLADHSLVRHQDDALGGGRYVMLRPIHAFAADMLKRSDDGDGPADRHAAFFRDLALESEPHLTRADDTWLDLLESERANIERALEHLALRGAVADALEAAVAQVRFWDARSYAREGLECMRALIAKSDNSTPLALRIRARYAAGILADACGDYTAGKQLFEEHLALTEELGDPRASSVSRNNLAVLLLRQGDYDGAIPHFESAVAAVRELGDVRAAAMGTANIGNAERMRGNYTGARRQYDAALALFRDAGDHANVAWALTHLGDVARDEGQLATARMYYRQGLATFVELKHKRGCGSVLMDLADISIREQALVDARALLEESLAHLADAGDQRGMIRVFEMLAGVAALDSASVRAVQLAGAVAGLSNALGSPLSEDERCRLEQRVFPALERLDPEARERAWRSGNTMSMGEVLSYLSTTVDV